MELNYELVYKLTIPIGLYLLKVRNLVAENSLKQIIFGQKTTSFKCQNHKENIFYLWSSLKVFIFPSYVCYFHLTALLHQIWSAVHQREERLCHRTGTS